MIDQGRVLLVDDEAMVREATAQWLELSGFSVECFSRAEQALERIDPFCPGILLTDVRMPGMDGLELMTEALKRAPDLPVILLTAHGDVDMATAAMREGAYDFIEKPFVPERLVERIRRACEKRRLMLENLRLQQSLASRSVLEARLIGISPAIQRLRRELLALAELDTNVIIYGETGTGKELVAQCLHEYSIRGKKQFVPINCGAIPENLIESELFGHEAGAFTHAAKRRIGKFEYASGGTLFLDEVGDMPLPLQAKLLRALQEGEIEPLGSNTVSPVDVRVIAATSRNLDAMIADGSFRSDLYYRLNVLEISIPPLRDRLVDLGVLCEALLGDICDGQGLPGEITDEGIAALGHYDWPGNIRELRNLLERALTMSEDDGLLDAESIFKVLPAASAGPEPRMSLRRVRPLARVMAEAEAHAIEEALLVCRGNRTRAARLLGISRSVLYEKLARMS